MRKALLFVLIFLSITSIILQLTSGYIREFLGKGAKAGIRIESNIPAKVLLNDVEVGNTPYQDDNLKPGDYQLSLKPDTATDSEQNLWRGYAKLNKGTLTIIIRDIGKNKEESSGEIISLEPGRGVTITSSPTGAEVSVDGKSMGVTPLTIPDLGEGEHQFILSKENFLKRSIRSKVISDLNLVLSVDLAITEPDLTRIQSTPITSSQEVIITKTPTGFLRVRDNPGLGGKEIGQVKPGEKLVMLEESPGWVRLRLKDGKEGWVSSSYIEKKSE